LGVIEDSSDNFYGATCEGGSNDDAVLFNISRPGFSFLTFLLLNKKELTASINSVFDNLKPSEPVHEPEGPEL